MNREIKFRGKSVMGNWCFGLLSISQGYKGTPAKGHYISNSGGAPWAFQVRPETVGQYIERKDKDDNELYFGDILKDNDGHIGVIIFENNCVIVLDGGELLLDYDSRQIERLGNIHDNPELLKQE